MPFAPVAPVVPLHAYCVEATSSLSSTPLKFASVPPSIFTPPAAQLAPGLSWETRTSALAPAISLAEVGSPSHAAIRTDALASAESTKEFAVFMGCLS